MWGVPASDRIRNEARVPTMAVGGITEADHANAMLLAGRADLIGVSARDAAAPAWNGDAAPERMSA
jgi:anthraniloyl-CoA monooxygenase